MLFELVVTLGIKIAVKALVADITTKVHQLPLTVASTVLAGWDTRSHQHKIQLLDYLHSPQLLDSIEDTSEAYQSALTAKESVETWLKNLKKPSGSTIDLTWDMIEVISAIGKTKESLSRIIGKAKKYEQQHQFDRARYNNYFEEYESPQPKPRHLKKKQVSRKRRRPPEPPTHSVTTLRI